jgi:hypothetical protein
LPSTPAFASSATSRATPPAATAAHRAHPSSTSPQTTPAPPATTTKPAGGSNSLASGTYHLWIGDNAAGGRLNVVFSGFNSLRFDIPGWFSGDGVLELDNLVVSDLAAVPEPSSAAGLASLAGLVVAASRRRAR